MAGDGNVLEAALNVILAFILGALGYVIYSSTQGKNISAVLETISGVFAPFLVGVLLTFTVFKIISEVS